VTSWHERTVRLWNSRTPREWLFAPVYYFLRNRDNRIGIRFPGGGMLLVGSGLSIYYASVLPGRIHIPRHAATVSIGTRWHKFHGGSHLIRVDGHEYLCRGSDRLAEHGSLVLHDPAHPSRCRHASLSGKLSRWEWLQLFDSAYFVVSGLGLSLVNKEDENRFRFWVSHTCLVLTLLALLMGFAWLPKPDDSSVWVFVMPANNPSQRA
jgi:hypothetical protein